MCGMYTCVCLSSKYADEQTTGKNASLDFYAAESHSVGFMNAQHRIYWLEEFLTNHGHR